MSDATPSSNRLTFLEARLGTICNIAEGELTAKAQKEIARLAREALSERTCGVETEPFHEHGHDTNMGLAMEILPALNNAGWNLHGNLIAAILDAADQHRSAVKASAPLDDGFGNSWERCVLGDACRMDIVRPGKVQCDCFELGENGSVPQEKNDGR